MGTVSERLAYVVKSARPVDEVAADLQAKLAQRGFRVLGVHDVQAMLAEKGFAHAPMKLIEF